MATAWEEGDPGSKLLILGEAPGKNEIRLGRPLIGQAGEVFTDCMQAAGLHRRECYIINLFSQKCKRDQLAGHIIEESRNIKLWDSKKGLTQDGLEAARPTLNKIDQSRCNAILAMGNAPLDALMGGHRPIGKWRGSPMQSTTCRLLKFIPTIHPAAALYGAYLSRYLIISDMQKMAKEIDDPVLRLPERNIKVRPTLAEVSYAFHDCRKAGRIATDLECLNEQVYCISVSWNKSNAVVIPLVDEKGAHWWDEQDEELIWKWYAEIMYDPSILKINHNIVGFDAPFLLRFCNVHMRGPIGDTMIAQHVVYPEFRKGLDTTASIHTREPYWKDEGRMWKNLAGFDWETFQRYCGKDACVSLEIWDVLYKEMVEGGYLDTYNMTVEMSDSLAYMSTDGLAVNKGGIAEINAQLEKQIAEGQAALNEACGQALNVNSAPQCQAYFYGKLGIPPYKNYGGGITTDDKAMSRIVRRAEVGSREAKLVQELRRVLKLKSTYMEVELDGDDRLRCSWNPRGTWTGRLSSSKTILGTGLNLQNLDPEFKGFVVAG